MDLFGHKNIFVVFLGFLLLVPLSGFAKEKPVVAADTTANDTLQKKEAKKESKITAPVAYSAADSIMLSMGGDMFLYGSGVVNYDKLNLTAEYIHFNTNTSIVDAEGRVDEEGEPIGDPVLKDGDQEYNAKSIRYNFVTKKGYVLQGVVQQGEGYIVGERTKKIDDDIYCMVNGKYTTCSDHEHPHFYLNLTKAKVKQGKWVAAGPSYLVLLDVPLPLALPFGFFPFTDSYSSGVIMPSYGDDLSRGFYLTDGGYYFAINDYMDLALTGDIYTKGTWAVRAASSYIKRYKFNGNANFSFRQDVISEKGLPDYSKYSSFEAIWSHRQDPKSSPNSTFSAGVNFSGGNYDRNSILNYPQANLLAQNTKSSSISYAYRFPNSPFSVSANLLASQRTADSTISLTLPDLTFTMSRIYPFKRKSSIGKERLYEKLYFSYSGHVTNSITTKENLLLESSFAKDWQKSFDHTIPVGASFNVLRYISITPTVNYHERWNFESIEQMWDYTNNTVMRDTISGFNRVYDFNAGVSLSTKFYGFYTPIRKIFGDKIDRIRHVFTPTLSYSYRPDFSDPFWGFYSSYMRPVSTTDPTLVPVNYSPYPGAPSGGESSAISFSINNNIEMKVKHEVDTVPEPIYKTVSLIDALGVGGGYNFAADSLNWSNFSGNIRLKFTDQFSLSLGAMFDTYMYGLDMFGNPAHINTPRWDVGKFPRFMGTSTSFGYSINNQTFKKKKAKTEEEPEIETEETIVGKVEKKTKKTPETTGDKRSIPFNLGFNYSINYAYSDFNKDKMEYNYAVSQNIGFNASLTLTENWNFNFSAAYNITDRQLTYSSLGIRRSLHCWSMTANIVPFGAYQTFNFMIQVDSSLLEDLKYEKRSDYSQPVNWY